MDLMNTRGWCQAILAFILVQIIGCYGYANRSVSACFDKQKTIRLECDTGYMVRIFQTFYGYSHTGQCAFKDGDCKLVEKEHYPCIGKQWCVINLPSGSLGNTIPGCSKRSTYFQADYACIKASETIDICAVTEVSSQSGYITTPRYPRNYPNAKLCTLTIRERPLQTFFIYVLDFYLPVTSATGCRDQLNIKSSTGELTLCGNRWNERLVTTYQKNTSVVLEFRSDESSPMKGFWIYYEAIPLLPTPPPPTTTSTSTTKKEDTTRPSGGGPGNLQNTSDGTEDIVKEKRRTGLPYPAAAIIGGVIGGLLLILAILVILLLIKRIRERKHHKASRTDLNTKRNTTNSHLQIQNNMGVSSQSDNNPSQFPSNNPCYNQSYNPNNNASCNPEYEGMRLENINSQNNPSDIGPGIIMC